MAEAEGPAVLPEQEEAAKALPDDMGRYDGPTSDVPFHAPAGLSPDPVEPPPDIPPAPPDDGDGIRLGPDGEVEE